jgi:heme/copper-type cytochrome/quinol oxidase subunit 2
MRRRTWMRPATVLSVLLLLTASCGVEDPDEAPDAAAEPDTDEPETHDEAADDDDAPAEPEEPSEEEGVGSGEPEQVTAYVVGYHWGWALFDENGDELDVLEVSVGSEVELIAVNDHAGHAISQLPEPVVEAISAISWHERVHHDMDMGRIPDLEQAEGVSLDEALTIAHDGHDHTGPAPDHGLMVAGIGLEAFLDAHGDEPARLVFTVDEEGAHEFRCTEDCGPGHDYQRREMLVVTA